VTTPVLALTSSHTTATIYSFQTTGDGFRSWALCTVNDATGELLITSDWGNWSHRWNTDHLGAPTLTAFIGDRDRGAVDYLAGKLQGRRGGQRFSAEKTAAAFRRMLCERRLEVGRDEIERPGSHRGYWLDRGVARDIWETLGEIAEDCSGSADLFLDRVFQIDGFTDHVDDTPYESLETEQTSEDRALRETILPALIAACAETHRTRTASEPPAPASDADVAALEALVDDDTECRLTGRRVRALLARLRRAEHDLAALQRDAEDGARIRTALEEQARDLEARLTEVERERDGARAGLGEATVALARYLPQPWRADERALVERLRCAAAGKPPREPHCAACLTPRAPADSGTPCTRCGNGVIVLGEDGGPQP
jgi:hypothetical protein